MPYLAVIMNTAASNEVQRVRTLLMGASRDETFSLHSYVRCLPDVLVVGCVSTLIEMQERICALQPHVLVVQYADSSVVEHFDNERPRIPIVCIADEEHMSSILQLFRLGIRGYVLGGRIQEDLPIAIKTVADGKRFVSPPIETALLNACFQHWGITPRSQK